MHRDPTVTVLMSVYNGERYLREAMDSVLRQSFPDFEFLVIDDASTDRTAEILESYPEPRIRLIRNKDNLGLTASLNKGIDLARGKYIARMDSDDISLPERLSRQVEFMEANPSVGVCGTWAKTIDQEGNVTGELRTLTGTLLKKYCWRPSPFLHPTVMAQATLLKANRYNPEYQQAQDYELWLRLCRITEFYNLDQYLVLYRTHLENIFKTKRGNQLLSSYKAFSEHGGNKNISYEDYLSLIPVKATVNPIRRARSCWLASAKTGLDFRSFIIDNLIYLKLWITQYNSLTNESNTFIG